MASSLMTRVLLAVLLLGNAVSSGVCAMLCSAKVCCPPAHVAAATAPAEKPCCHLCKPKAASRQIAAVPNAPGDDCCAWIGKKVDPPASLAKAISAVNNLAIAVLPSAVVVPVAEPITDREQTVLPEDRAPPSECADPCQPRAPPIVSM